MKNSKNYIKLKDLNFKNAGFTAPKGYFERVESQVLLKVSGDIPNNYFNTLETKILSKLNIKNSPEVKIIPLKSIFLKRILPFAVAASVVLFIGLNFINKFETVTFETLDTTNINNYLALVPDYSNSYNLGEFLTDADFSQLSNTYAPIEDLKLETYLNQTDIEELILNN